MLAMDSSIIGRTGWAIESSRSRMSTQIVTLVRWPVGPAAGRRCWVAGAWAGRGAVVRPGDARPDRRRRDRGRPPPRDDGPYRFVRHPMYAAVLVFAFGSALAFGSYGIATVALVFLPVAISWAATEERLLASSANLGAEYATTCGAPVGIT